MDHVQQRTVIAVPEGLAPGFGYSHVVVGSGRFVILSGQVALDRDGQIVGPDDIAAQARQVFENIGHCLRAAGATWQDAVKLTYYLTDIRHLALIRDIRDQFIDAENPPASTAIQVAALALPGLMIEVEAMAILSA